LARHPNIAGIKASCDPGQTRQLIDLVPQGFRVIVAAPDLMDVLIRGGIADLLDGMYAVAPHWVVALAQSAQEGRWKQANRYQQDISHLRRLVTQNGVGPMFTAMMNAKGIPGRFGPRPSRALTSSEHKILQNDAVMQKLLREHPVAAG
jgi:dihydrodipicolinate synthase/N-acetylneuraminate lyase